MTGLSCRAAPTAASNANIRSATSGGTVTALKTVIAERAEEATAYKRDYEERAREFAEDVAFEETPEEASEAADARALAAERRARAVMQGYTGNMCSECQNFTMVRNGTCEKCDTCGSTSGCS